MKRIATLTLPVLISFVQIGLAQTPPAPKPGPEQKKLAYFVGQWKTEGEMKPGAMGPGGKFTSTDRSEMFPGGFFLVMHSTGTTPMGTMREIAIMGYDPNQKLYTYDGFDNMGEHDISKGTLEGDTWKYNSETKMGGQVYKGRFTMKEISPSEYTFKFEMSPDGATWTTAVEGKSTKISAPAAAERKASK